MAHNSFGFILQLQVDKSAVSLVYLLGLKALKHLRSYRDGACLYYWYFDQCAATQKCHAAHTGHDTPPRHSIQTQGMAPHPVTVYRHRAWHPTLS